MSLSITNGTHYTFVNQPRKCLYIVVGKSIDEHNTVEVMNFVTDDKSVAFKVADEENNKQSEVLYEVVETNLVTRQTVIEDEFINPIIDVLRRFTTENSYISSEELASSIEALFFSDEMKTLLSENVS